MYHFKNGDRCPCCGTVIQGKDRDWLLQFSAEAYALGFQGPEDWADVSIGPCNGAHHKARREPGRTAEGS